MCGWYESCVDGMNHHRPLLSKDLLCYTLNLLSLPVQVPPGHVGPGWG